MAFGYDNQLTTDKDQVRFLIRDTNSARPFFQDEEIVWAISQAPNIYIAGAELCEQLLLSAGGVKSKKIGDFAISYDPSFYRMLAGSLRARGMGNQMPYAGGISQSDKQIQQGDTDAVQPSIMRRLDDNPAAPQPQIPPKTPLETL